MKFPCAFSESLSFYIRIESEINNFMSCSLNKDVSLTWNNQCFLS